MAGGAHTPQDDSGGSQSARDLSDPAKRRWRGGHLVIVLSGAALGGWLVLEVFDPFGDPVEREVARLMKPVRHIERNQTPLYRWIGEFRNGPPPLSQISRGILGPANTSNQPDTTSEDLQDLGEPAIPILLRLAAQDSSWGVRTVAVEVLGALGATNAFTTITQSLAGDSAASVRSAAAGALGQIKPHLAAPALLAALSREQVEEVRIAVVRAIAMLGATLAFDPLMQILEGDTSVAARQVAAEALGKLGDRRAAPALRSLLVTNDIVRTAAIGALGELRDREAVPQLLALLETAMPAAAKSSEPAVSLLQSDSTRQSLAQALGKIGDPRATDPLARALPRLADEWELYAFLEALGQIGDPKAIPALRSVIANQPKLATRAAEALGRIDNPDTTRELIALLDSPNREIQVASAIALANLGEKAAVTNLLEAMKSGPQRDAKQNIVDALGIVGDAAAVPHLIEALKDSEEDVRTQAAWALGNIGDPTASEALMRTLKDSAFGVRFAAAFALAIMTNAAAVPRLEPLLGDQERRVRIAAACSLAFHGSERGLPQLTVALKRLDDWQRFGAVIALHRLNTPAARELARSAVDDRDAGVRKLASQAVEHGPGTALTTTLKDGSDDHRYYAARMLLFFDDPAAIPALRAAVRDPRIEVRVAARVALRRLERIADGK
jgi:HEAT repeat protein